MRTRLSIAIGCSLALVACSGDDGAGVTATVSDHADALTDAPGDNLATFKLATASEPYDTTLVTLTVGEAGATPLQINFTLQDGDADGKFGEGESLTLVEPGLNRFDSTSIGKTFVVSFRVEEDGGVLRQLATETWKPEN